MTLELSGEEADLLSGILRRELGSIREEVYHSDTLDYKDQLKHEEVVLRTLIGKLGPVREQLSPERH